MMAKRCALALLCVGVLPTAAEDAVWSGAAPSSAFTGSATADAGKSHAADVQRCKGCSDHVPASLLPPVRSEGMQPQTATIADAPASASTTESRLASGWVLALLVAGVAGCGALVCYAMGFFSCGSKRAAGKKKRAAVLEEPLDEESALPTQCIFCGNIYMPDANYCRKCGHNRIDGHMNPLALAPQSVVPAVAAPLSAYQVVSSPAPVPGPMPSAYYATQAMSASGAVPSAAYATPQAPMYSVGPPIAAPAPTPFLPTEPMPFVPTEPMPFLPTEPLPVR